MTQTELLNPPIARKEHTEAHLNGAVLVDDYAWLRDKESPDVTAYLEAENAYAEAVMAPLASLREDLYQEMLSHIKQTDVSVPFRDGAWWYYTRTEEGSQYAIHCRRHADGRVPPVPRTWGPGRAAGTYIPSSTSATSCRAKSRESRWTAAGFS